jgi:hypothetical protein
MMPNVPVNNPNAQNRGQYEPPVTPPQWQGHAPTQQIPRTSNINEFREPERMYQAELPRMSPGDMNNPGQYAWAPPGYEYGVDGYYQAVQQDAIKNNNALRPNPNFYPAPAKSKKKRRVFLWVFLAVQALFLIWLITGIARTSNSGATAHSQAIQFCSSKANWQYLYKSSADCVTHYGNALNGASSVGKSIGAGIVIALWVVVDFFMGLGFMIYKLTQRH